MSKKTKFPTPFEVNVNISPPKSRKKSQNIAGCILQCTEGNSSFLTFWSDADFKNYQRNIFLTF